MKLYEYMAYELLEKIQNREITIEEVVYQVYERIEETDDKLHSFVHLSKEKAVNRAQQLDINVKNGKSIGKLYGLPMGVKDLICIKDSPTTCGSKILQDYIPVMVQLIIHGI